MGRRFSDFEEEVDPEEVVEEPSLLGWVIIFVLLALAAGLWYYAAPAYVDFLLGVDQFADGVKILGDGTIPGREPEEFAVVMFDVGYGDGFLLQAPDNKTVLIDGGEGADPAERGVRAYNWAPRLYLPFFSRIGLKKIDKMLNLVPYSHHLGVQPDLLEAGGVDVGKIYLTGYEPHFNAYQRLVELAEQQGVTRRELQDRAELDFGASVKAEVIYGDPEQRHPEAASHVLYVKFGEVSFLFPGDLPEDKEESLTYRWGNRLSADVLKVADHGSEDSTAEAFLEYVQPDYALISTSEAGPDDELPSPEVVSNLENRGVREIFRTDQLGHVILFTDGESIRVETDPFPFLGP